jgi:hypothetical protein
MEYDKKFIDTCEAIFAKIIQNRPLKECLNTAVAITSDHLWFIYYMFFAIHNPKMEDYIQKKTNAIQEPEPESGIISTAPATADIIKNMIKRRHYTSTIVFRLYTHAYTNNGNVTHIYPKYKNGADRLIKSFQSNHLKTTAVHIRRTFAAASSATAAVIPEFLAYIITSAPTTPASSTASAVLHKINNHIHYKRKDIIILALVCYMKIHEADINTKNIFIASTPEELAAATTTATATASSELEISSLPIPIPIPYDEKYKYLYI